MNLEELRSVQRAERQKDSLQHLPDSFYADVADYIAQLKDERQRAVAAADDPFSDDVRQLTDRIEATTEVANALYERRVGKVVKHASFAAADMAADDEGLTTEERELFDDLVARIRENRETVLATLEGAREGSSTTQAAPDSAATGSAGEPSTEAASPDLDATAPPRATDANADADGLLADALGDGDGDAATSTASTDDAEPATADAASVSDAAVGDDARPATEAAAVSGTSAGDSTDGSAGRQDTDRTTLRITADVGTVYGVDEREYDLAREDVVDLPTTNAKPLLRKDAAERID
jgi:DNA replication factor GINS